jgi:tRNA 5-methylaminomethyl-2-thiouridine biosynthesis bifunctional protein
MEIPFSDRFNDIYFSKDGGIEETKFVFLEGNNLFQRWNDLKNRNFTICETGFGTGLNFLCTWNLWKEIIKKNNSQELHKQHWLHFISTEAYPLTKTEIHKYLQHLTEINAILNIFLDVYELFSAGFYRFNFPDDCISLTILFGDININLPELVANVDAWFLDGFAPSKNPEMWTKTVFQEMNRLSHSNTTFSTYTSASLVRSGLSEAGFEVIKKNGYGRKREMSYGYFKDSTKIYKQKQTPKKFKIAGAGIAGASLAYALKLRKMDVTVYDPIGIAREASGNPVGIFYPYLAKFPIPSSLFSLSSFYYANQILNSIPTQQRKTINPETGLLYKLDSQDKLNKYSTSIKSHNLPESVAHILSNSQTQFIMKNSGQEIKSDNLYFPSAKSISPVHLIQFLLDEIPFINESLNDYFKPTNPQEFEKKDNESNKIQLDNSNNSIIIYCNSYHLLKEKFAADTPLKKVRGQLYIANQDDPIYSYLKKNPSPMCSESYLTKNQDGIFVVGSTYDEFKTDRDWTEEDECKILERLESLTDVSLDMNIEDIIEKRKSTRIWKEKNSNQDSIEGNNFRISHRSQTRDRAPIIGRLGENWIYSGLGSRGLVTSLLGGEILASMILDEPLPVPKFIVHSLAPERFSKNVSNHRIQKS